MAEPTDEVKRTGFVDNYDSGAEGDGAEGDGAEGDRAEGDRADGDFAEEHEDTTFADDTADGPEHAREPDQPRGRDGLG